MNILLDWTYRSKETSVCIAEVTGKMIRAVVNLDGNFLRC